MARLITVLLLLLTAGNFSLADEPKKDIAKHWYIALGPSFSASLIGTGGTKYNFSVGYSQGLTERVDLLYFYDAAVNTSSIGSTLVTEAGGGLLAFLGDRGVDIAPFLRIDLGFGGNNRYVDAGPMAGVGVGVQLYRTKEATIEILYRHNTTLTQATTNLGAYPSVDEFDIGVIF